VDALQYLVRLSLVLGRENVKEVVLALRLRHIIEPEEVRTEVLAVNYGHGVVAFDSEFMHELLGEDFEAVRPG
jgi:hypothetical protein